MDKLQIESNSIPLGVNSVLCVKLQGDIRYGQEVDLKQEVFSRLEATTRGVVLDLSGVNTMDSSGMGALAALTQKLVAKKAPLVITGLSPQLQNILDVGGMLDMFITRSDVQEGVDFLRARLG